MKQALLELDDLIEALTAFTVVGAVLVERKTYADFATSLADGRLFSQVAALAHSPIARSSSSKVLSRRACPTCILTP